MAYQPTGKPPGRPRTKEPKPEEAKASEVYQSPFHAIPVTQFAESACAECWPGVTKFQALTCTHGTFIRKA